MSDIIDIGNSSKNAKGDENVLNIDAFRKDRDEEGLADTHDEVSSEIAVAFTHHLIRRLQKSGYVIEDCPEVAHDILLIAEAVKSITYTLEGIDYPMHKIAEGLFPLENPSEFLEEFLDSPYGDEDE